MQSEHGLPNIKNLTLMYDIIYLILNNNITKPILKELHSKHIGKEWIRRPDAIKAMALKFSRASVANS